jgi:hypothetical protein
VQAGYIPSSRRSDIIGVPRLPPRGAAADSSATLGGNQAHARAPSNTTELRQ